MIFDDEIQKRVVLAALGAVTVQGRDNAIALVRTIDAAQAGVVEPPEERERIAREMHEAMEELKRAKAQLDGLGGGAPPPDEDDGN